MRTRRREAAAPKYRTAAAVPAEPPGIYRHEPSLSLAQNWDGQDPARGLGDWLLVEVGGLHDGVERLMALDEPFLDWVGKAEGLL